MSQAMYPPLQCELKGSKIMRMKGTKQETRVSASGGAGSRKHPNELDKTRYCELGERREIGGKCGGGASRGFEATGHQYRVRGGV